MHFAWIFPFVCFAMMVVMLLFMMGRGGMGCVGRGRSTDRFGFRDSAKRPWSESSGTALEILNERFVKGEIDKQEYEQKKSAITSAA